MEKLTIYTTTYNRANLLSRVYNSLKDQTCKDFIWMVVDDGSTDNTKELMDNCMKNNNGFRIEYYYKENGGVHTAREFAYKHCKTELIVSCDSDAYYVKDAVKMILDKWNSKDSEDYCGIFCGNSLCKKKFPNVKAVTFQDLTFKYKYKYDKLTVVKTDIMKEMDDYPVFDNEKLVSEGYKWLQLPTDKKFLLIQEDLTESKYLADGYTLNARKNFFANLNGFNAYYKQFIKCAIYIKPKIKGHIGYIITSILLKKKNFIKDSPNWFVTLLLTPLGVAGTIYLLIKEKR